MVNKADPERERARWVEIRRMKAESARAMTLEERLAAFEQLFNFWQPRFRELEAQGKLRTEVNGWHHVYRKYGSR